MGKGDNRRPTAVDHTTFQSNWERTFGGGSETYEWPDVRCSDSPLAHEDSPAGQAYRYGWSDAGSQHVVVGEMSLADAHAYDAGWRDYHKFKQYAEEDCDRG